MNKIQKLSRRVRVVLLILFFFTPVFTCYFWLLGDTPYDVLNTHFDVASYTSLPLTWTTRILSAIVGVLFHGIAMYALWILIRLFRNYEHGEIFSLENVRCYQKLSYSLFYWVMGSVINHVLMSVILSHNNSTGKHVINLSFNDNYFWVLMVGCIILIISWVMKEGYLLADENRHTI